MRIYLDTSVINGLYAEDEPRIVEITRMFFRAAESKGTTLYASDLVVAEIERTPDRNLKEKLLGVLLHYRIEILPTTREAKELAEEFISKHMLPQKCLADALHIANAAVHNIPVLVSWNFEHMVKHKTRVTVNIINQDKGYPQIDICSPEEI